MSDAFVCNVVTVLNSVPVDFGDPFVGFGFGFFQSGRQGHYVEDAAAIDYVFSVFLHCSGVEYDASGFFRFFQSGNDFTGGS